MARWADLQPWQRVLEIGAGPAGSVTSPDEFDGSRFDLVLASTVSCVLPSWRRRTSWCGAWSPVGGRGRRRSGRATAPAPARAPSRCRRGSRRVAGSPRATDLTAELVPVDDGWRVRPRA
ncbi:hypothetical protein [Jiangella sp. DSM 45060]|uniref:hypothetical protein n=1 Tax=Jiangella sp. DSM 45060 TaxID=1798224 RepID=UPI00087CC6A3|nr:hypothetical protein [Jiangella sp. DSM 45060]SDT68656.1 hypothetical protein SAMN04515669_5903 [Jiangella sp. DSM 45060]